MSVVDILDLWATTGSVIVDGATLNAGTLQGTGGSIRISDPPGGAALTIGSSAVATFSGSISDNTGPGSVQKIGSGTQVLNGRNTYSGDTIITAGTLALGSSGSISNSRAINVAGSVLDYDFGSVGMGYNGRTVVTGVLTLPVGGTVTLDLEDNADNGGLGSIGDGTYDLFSYGSLTNLIFDPAAFAVGTAPLGFEPGHKTYTFANDAADGQITLTISSVPEPSSFTLLGVSVVSLAAYAWRRKQRAY